jgi:hypothetical protein
MCAQKSKSKLLYVRQFLSPITLSLCQAPWDPRPMPFFCQLNPYSHSPYLTPSLMRWVCLFWICLKSSVSTGFAKQIMAILFTLCYSGSLVTWTVIILTTAKFIYIYKTPRCGSTDNTALLFCVQSVGFPMRSLLTQFIGTLAVA